MAEQVPRAEAQPQEQRELNKFLDQLLSEAKSARSKLEPDWRENSAYLRGDQWSGRTRPQGFAQVTDNQVWRIVQQAAALLTDTKPYIEITSRPDDPRWDQVNKRLKKLVEAQWFLNDVDRSLVRIIYDLFTTGKAFHKVYWDPLKEWELGDISIVRVSPSQLYVDPHADSLQNAEYICYRVPMSLWEIRRRFPPELASQVKPDPQLSSYEDTESPRRFIVGIPMPRSKQKAEASAIPKAWVEEWWIRDPSTDESGNPLYTAGRMIHRSGNVILSDGPNPYWDPWPGPWVEYTFNPLDDSFYGEPEVKQLRQLQDAINVLQSLIVDNARFLTAGVWIIDSDALSESERRKLPTARPGTVIAKKPGREVRRDVGATIPSQIGEVVQSLKASMQFISGLMDQAYGRPPRGITAQGAIELLQMASQATIRIKAREIEAGLVRLGQRVIARIFQFYRYRRVVDFLGEQGIESLVWDPEEEFGQLLGEPGSPVAVTEEDRRRLLRQFRIRISPGSSLALSKERQWSFHMALYGAQAIDQEALLEAIDYPNRQAIVERMREQRMAAAAMGAAMRGRRDGARAFRQLVR